MVDDSLFTKEGTVARSSQDIVRFFYLQRLEDLLRSQKEYYSTPTESAGFKRSRLEWKASILSILSLCKPRLEVRTLKYKEKNYLYKYDELKRLVDNNKYEEVTNLVIEYLELDLKITDISKVQDFDRTNIILSNKMKGYK